jgi:hypothetical protein
METAQQRRTDIRASNVLFGSLLFSIVILLLRIWIFKLLSTSLHPAIWLTVLTPVALCAGIYYAIRLGQHWAKLLLLLVFILGVAFNVWDYQTLVYSLHSDRLYVINYIVGYVCQVWALVLLFRKPRQSVA